MITRNTQKKVTGELPSQAIEALATEIATALKKGEDYTDPYPFGTPGWEEYGETEPGLLLHVT